MIHDISRNRIRELMNAFNNMRAHGVSIVVVPEDQKYLAKCLEELLHFMALAEEE